MSVLDINDSKLSCFGNDVIRVRAWLDRGPAIGFLPPTIEPAWLAYASARTRDQQGYFALWSEAIKDSDVAWCEPVCKFHWVHVPPDSTLDLHGPARWIIAIGHLDDPVAERCHWNWPPDWEVDPSYTTADAVASCRHGFVLEAIEEIE